MAEEFEDRDLSDAVFWGVNLSRALFRDIDLTDARFFHGRFAHMSIDGIVDELVINGVDVTEYVNAHDRWFPLRTQLEPASPDELSVAWSTLVRLWEDLLGRVSEIGTGIASRSVNGEWNLHDTLRHLVFVHDKWFRWPLLEEREFAAIGLPNTGSQGGEWPGLDLTRTVSYADLVEMRRRYQERFSVFVESTAWNDIPVEVDVLENGRVPGAMCLHAVLEEEFEHLRYMIRDLEVIAAS